MRREGKSKLVFNKETRSIETVCALKDDKLGYSSWLQFEINKLWLVRESLEADKDEYWKGIIVGLETALERYREMQNG